MATNEQQKLQLTEDQVPLEGIRETAVDLVEFYGGTVHATSAGGMDFVLPMRRSVAAAGELSCRLVWDDSTASDAKGTVRIFAEEESSGNRLQRIALLIAGTIGAILWTLFFFFPTLGPLSMIGGTIAFATYFLALRKRGGVAVDFLKRLVAVQKNGIEN